MRRLGRSTTFKTLVFLFTIGLLAAMILSAAFLINTNSREYVPMTPFTRSADLGDHLQQVVWSTFELEKDLDGQWPASGIVELKDLTLVAPLLNPTKYATLLSGNLTLFYRNETTGNIITNYPLVDILPSIIRDSTYVANQLMMKGFAFNLNFRQGYITPGTDQTLTDLPPQFQQSVFNLADNRQAQLTMKLDTTFSRSDDLLTLARQYAQKQAWSTDALVIFGTAALLFLLAWLLLIHFAGRQPADERIRLSWLDRIDAEVLFAGSLLLALLMAILAASATSSHGPQMIALGFALYPLAAAVLLSLVRRCRAGILWRQSLTGRLIRLLRQFYDNRPLFWKVLIAYAAYVLLVFFSVSALASSRAGTAHILLVLLALVGLPTVFVLLPAIRWSVQFQKVSVTASSIADHPDDASDSSSPEWPEDKLNPDLQRLAASLATTRQYTQQAVAEQMKSERLKTDLISNVSHDLKTPLTAIISYLDLLKREQNDPGKREEYLDILEQKAERLKMLTDNLFEAAKASSGSLPVQRGPVNLNELVHQVAGEFTDQLAQSQLELVIDEPKDAAGQPEPIGLLSDGGHIWRILDNLMTNACKYAFAGTRVYLDIRRENGSAVLELKNISKERLNCSAEELQQRFVRGDQSRHTDGSGLGLAIATSLAELLGGKLSIQLDGDLFKASLKLPIEPAAMPAQQRPA